MAEVDPQWVMLAPVTGIQNVLKRAGWSMDSVGFVLRAQRSLCRCRLLGSPANWVSIWNVSTSTAMRSPSAAPDWRQWSAHSGDSDPRDDPPRRSSRSGRAVPGRWQLGMCRGGRLDGVAVADAVYYAGLLMFAVEKFRGAAFTRRGEEWEHRVGSGVNKIIQARTSSSSVTGTIRRDAIHQLGNHPLRPFFKS